MSNISNKKNFFIEGSGTAQVIGKSGKLEMIHLQDMNLEITTSTENIYGGETNFSLYAFNTDRNAKVTFQNASWNIDMINFTQGANSDSVPTFFESETLKVGSDSSVTLSHANVDWTSAHAFDSDNKNVTIASYSSVEGSGKGVAIFADTYIDEKLTITYDYTGSSAEGVSTAFYTTKLPGYVTIKYISKPIKQNDDDETIIRYYITIYKARSDGQFTIDFKHKNAFAPELTFDIVDPEREDKKFIRVDVKDVTAEESV